MNPNCIKVVQAAAAAAGRRALTKAELKRIDDDMSATLKLLSQRDPNWPSMTRDQRLTAASNALMAQIAADAKRAKDNALQQIVKQAQVDNSIKNIRAATKGASLTDATKRHMANTHNMIRQIRNSAVSGLMDTIEALGDKTGAGMGRRFMMAVFDAENPIMTRDVIREIYKGADGHTGNKMAQAGAKAWLETVEKLRTRFNAAGGDVGRLDYGYVPRNWDASRVRKAGADKWAADMLPEIDRARMVNEDGSRMSDAEVMDFLRSSWGTLSTSGVNKQVPGEYHGTGKRANRGSDHRLIHFKDGEADLRIRAMYGRGSVFDAMAGHIGGISRDIGLVERYGPDPASTARLRFDMIAQGSGKELNEAIGMAEIDPRTYWDMISGKTSTPVNERMANIGVTARNIQTFGKLGGAMISSMTDVATVAITTGYNRMSYWEVLKDVGRQVGSKEAREWMNVQGIVADSLAQGIDRWSGDFLGQNWSGKLANATMKLSLMNRWTDSMRQGFNMAMASKLAELAKKPWADVSQFDRARLERAGIGAPEWAVLRQTTPAKYKGGEYLTPASVKNQDVADKLGAWIMDEGEFAVVNPDLRTRALTTMGGQQAGTPGGEFARTVTQFKSFPIALISRHWARMLTDSRGLDGAPMLANRAMYGFALMTSLTALGAIVTQTKQTLQGKDPIDMTGDHAGRFWTKAFAQGGGLGIMGDLFLIDPHNGYLDAGTMLVKNMAGPTVGTFAEVVAKDVIENVWQEAAGKDSDAAAEIARTMTGLTPGVGLWWVKPFFEHGVTHAFQENMSPGYLSRMKSRTKRDWGNEYWWRPGEVLPDRAPDIGMAVENAAR